MSLEKISVCPICKSESFGQLFSCKDFTTSQEVFHVEQCMQCQLAFTNPRPQESEAGKYYNSSSYISHTSAAEGLIGRIYLIVRHFALKRKLSLVTRKDKKPDILDVGAGTGHFVNYCRDNGRIAFGVEPSEAAKASSGNKNVVGAFAELPKMQFDVITMWHVLEHVYSLQETLDELKSRLKKNGTIFIAVPNKESYDAIYYQELWAAYDVPRHIWHFTKKTMTDLLGNNGLKVKEIIPMKMDAYYVSLLSEKNKANGRLHPFKLGRAIIVGMISNLSGARIKNQSSLIYVVEKC